MGGGRTQVLIWGAAAVLALLAVMRAMGGHDQGQAAAVPVGVNDGAASVSGGEDSSASGGGTGGLFVHVAGRVRRPGLYRLRAGARVANALQRAGGPTGGADLAAINLAAKVEDGQQVLVPKKGAAPVGAAAPPGGTGSAGAAGPGEAGHAKLSLTTATVEQLDGLDGIGPTLAKRIVDYRNEHGGFRSVDDLNQVEGIGQKRMQALRKAVGP
jgi:competence protein ComEA